MSYLLGQMEATRIIGQAIHKTGEELITKTSAYDHGVLLSMLGASFIRAANTMEEKIRADTCRDGLAPDQPREGPGARKD